jgi:hypothetical protein
VVAAFLPALADGFVDWDDEVNFLLLGDESKKAGYRSRLESYRAGKPYREVARVAPG